MSSSDRLYYSLPIRCSMPHRLLLPPQGKFIKLANNHNQTCCDIPTKSNNIARTLRQRGDLNPCGQSPMDFESITLTTRSRCHVQQKSKQRCSIMSLELRCGQQDTGPGQAAGHVEACSVQAAFWKRASCMGT